VNTVLPHVLSVAHGIGASLACAGLLYVCGLALVPRRLEQSLARGESPAVLGAALYVLLCWFGISFGIPLIRLAAVFAAAALLLAALRYRWLRDAARQNSIVGRSTLGWVLSFSLLYILSYLFTMPPANGEYLPLAWTGNVDLLTYLRYTKYLQRLGPSNLVGFSYLNFVYLQTPAVFYLLSWLSLLFGQDPMRAAMPAQFALAGLIGVMAARISHSVFKLSRTSALAIACILVSGPFFRYVAASYFLSTLMATPVLLYLLWTTVTYRPQRLLDAGLAIRFASSYILLLFMYPFLLFAGLMAQAAAIGLMLIAKAQGGTFERRQWIEPGRHALRMACSALVPLTVLILCLFQRFTWSLDMVTSLSQKGVAGWPLEIVSPLSMLGWPGTMTDRIQCPDCFGVEIRDPANRVVAAAGFCAIALTLGWLYFRRFRAQTTPAQRTFAGLAGGALVIYCAYYFALGPSYQQWKFASYSALPLSFVVLAGSLHLVRQSAPFVRAARTALGRRLTIALLALVSIGFIAGNLAMHAAGDPRLLRFSGALRNIETVDKLPFFQELSVSMNEWPNGFPTWLALYFLPTKRVHVISSVFRPSEPLSFEQVSRQHPLLVQDYSCDGVGHDDTITVPGVGCLLLAPPSLRLGTPYPFSSTYLFIELDGLSGREPWGRWNGRRSVLLKLTADMRRIRVDQSTYVNLLVGPYLPPGAVRQRLRLSWGAGRHAEISIDRREWISLPVRSADWSGNQVWTLPITIEFPDAVPPHWVDAPEGRFEERRPLAVAFEILSISVDPDGRPVGAATGAAE
jgi:hypothetical protein